LFTVLNVTLWILAIIFFVWAFWLLRKGGTPDRTEARGRGSLVTGDVLLNDNLADRSANVVSAHQGDQSIDLGVSSSTKFGGSLTLNLNGTYSYSPPPWEIVPPGGLKEAITYTIQDDNGDSTSSILLISVNDSDRPVDSRSPWNRLVDFYKADSWTIKATRWTLLILVVVGIVIFFRVYNIGGIPAEPFSDHAEKLLDVYDVSQGQTHIFFPRNTGREAIQMYLTLVVSWIFGTGLTFLSLKIGTVFCGLVTLPYIYLLGKELGGKRIALLAVFFAGIAYWPNIISRVGLRFTLYPLFVAPTLFYLLRGLRTHNRNDFIVSGLFLGFGLHGYSPFRIMPFVVVAAVGLYLLHSQSKGNRKQAIIWLSILALISLIVFLPLARYWVENPDAFGGRAFSRLGSTEQPLPGPWWQILISNTWNSLRMYNWDNGSIWVHSVPGRPAFDVVSAALFLIGAVLVLLRYLRQRHWVDLFLLISIPLLQLPSTLSLAFPAENPSLNRAAAAFIPAILVLAIGLDGLLKSIESRRNRAAGTALVWIVTLGLAGWSSYNNYDLVFNQYATEFRLGAWNTSEIADVIHQFAQVNGAVDDAWVVPYPYWVDTRLVGDWLNLPDKDFALWPQDFQITQKVDAAKLFILKPEDTGNLGLLEHMYPQGILTTYHSAVVNAGKDFQILFVPPANQP
ncbi:MAG: glycosyltransferase family 39 protein, partial [Anaerolineales bacterium]